MAVLRLQDPYPVSVRNEIGAVAGVELSRGTIYVTPLRLERRGLVESWLGEPTAERGGTGASSGSRRAAAARSGRLGPP